MAGGGVIRVSYQQDRKRRGDGRFNSAFLSGGGGSLGECRVRVRVSRIDRAKGFFHDAVVSWRWTINALAGQLRHGPSGVHLMSVGAAKGGREGGMVVDAVEADDDDAPRSFCRVSLSGASLESTTLLLRHLCNGRTPPVQISIISMQFFNKSILDSYTCPSGSRLITSTSCHLPSSAPPWPSWP